MITKSALLLPLIILSGSVGAQSPAVVADYYVAVTGSDSAAGTFASPFATLQRARDAVRELKKTKADKEICVAIRGGYYPVTDTIVFGMEDSAAAGQQIVYSAYPGERPVFGAGVPVTDWKKTENAIGKIWCAPLPETVSSCTVLFKGEQTLPRSKSKGFVPVDGGTRKNIIIPEGVLPPDADARGMELLIIPEHSWVANLLPITGWEPTSRMASVSVPATYRLIKVPNRYFPDGTAWLENAVEFISAPGQWALDKKTRTVYLRHDNNEPPEGIVAPALTELIRVEGEINYDQPQDIPVKGLTFRGLTFMHSDFRQWQEDKVGWGVQHDWEMFDRPTAMLRFRGAENCIVEQCEFTAGGSTAIRCDLYSQQIQLKDNHIHHIGNVGILFAGYGPGTKDVNHHNVIERNRIHDVGEILFHAPAVFLWQSGSNLVSSNILFRAPYSGIVISCRAKWDRNLIGECGKTIRWNEVDIATGGASNDAEWGRGHSFTSWTQREPFLHGRGNVVEYNNISDCMRFLDDGNGVYISGTGDGNHIRNNLIHSIDSPRLVSVLRCDDDQHGVLIYNNIMANSSAEGFINKGRNVFTNNILYKLRSTTSDGTERSHNRGYLIFPYGDAAGATVQRNIFYSDDPVMPVMTENQFPSLGKSQLRQSDVDNNIYYNVNDRNWGENHLKQQQPHGIELNSKAVDPLFTDADAGDFSLRSESPALKLGFVPIDTGRIVSCPPEKQ